MADQTDVAVTCGFIAACPGAVALHKFTGASKLIAYPVGALAAFFLVALLVYIVLSLAASLLRNDPPGK